MVVHLFGDLPRLSTLVSVDFLLDFNIFNVDTIGKHVLLAELKHDGVHLDIPIASHTLQGFLIEGHFRCLLES